MVSPDQAIRLLEAVRGHGRTRRHLLVLFALPYYAALHPAKAPALGKGRTGNSGAGAGAAYRPKSEPTTGAAWADNGRRREVWRVMSMAVMVVGVLGRPSSRLR
jgi:hypothetical protein